MSRDLHRHLLGNTGPHEAADGRASKVVIQHSLVHHLHLRLGVLAILARLLVECRAGYRINRWLHSTEPELDAAGLPHFSEPSDFSSAAAPIQTETHIRAILSAFRMLLHKKRCELRDNGNHAALVVFGFAG